jgi:ABC-2 type transport system ATP-binding protein
VLARRRATLQIATRATRRRRLSRAALTTTTRDDELGEALWRAFTADGRFRLRALSRVHPTLEDVFLAATRRSWDVVDNKANAEGE